MRNTNFSRAKARSVVAVLAAALVVLLSAGGARAASWKGIEPFVSKRADVERYMSQQLARALGRVARVQRVLRVREDVVEVPVVVVLGTGVAVRRILRDAGATHVIELASNADVAVVALRNAPFRVEGRGRIAGARRTTNTMDFDVEAVEPVRLVLSVTRHKYWRATIVSPENNTLTCRCPNVSSSRTWVEKPHKSPVAASERTITQSFSSRSPSNVRRSTFS